MRTGLLSLVLNNKNWARGTSRFHIGAVHVKVQQNFDAQLVGVCQKTVQTIL